MVEQDNFDVDGLLLRKANPDDLELFDDVVSGVYFDIGLHNWRLFYSLCPEEFWVLVDRKTNKIVGVLSGNRLNDQTFWGHHVVILPEYRKKNRFKLAISLIPQRPYFIGNRNANSINVFRNDPCFFGHKLIGFFGKLTTTWDVKPPDGIKLIKLHHIISENDPTLVEKIFLYDQDLYRNISAPNRRRFIEKWLFPEDPTHSYSVVAYDTKSNVVCGYGVGRLMTSDFSSIAPMYSDSDAIAYSLIRQLANGIKNAEHVYIEFNAKRRICFEFAKHERLLLTYSNFRIYQPYVCDFPMEKQYCDHEFWPI